MSDDLVKRLRAMLEGDMRPSPLGKRAADRIEELETKLAKAVEGLKRADQAIMENTTDYDLLTWGEPTVSHIRNTLAELTGGKDE